MYYLIKHFLNFKESENEEDEDEDMEVDEKFRASVKEALGQLAVKGEDDDGQDDKEEDEEVSYTNNCTWLFIFLF